jgi:hypothetical protein
VSHGARIARSLELFRQAIAAHDRESVTHVARGIGLSALDMRRLGFEEGEELWPMIRVHVDCGRIGSFRVLCNGLHGDSSPAGEAGGAWEGELAAGDKRR